MKKVILAFALALMSVGCIATDSTAGLKGKPVIKAPLNSGSPAPSSTEKPVLSERLEWLHIDRQKLVRLTGGATSSYGTALELSNNAQEADKVTLLVGVFERPPLFEGAEYTLEAPTSLQYEDGKAVPIYESGLFSARSYAFGVKLSDLKGKKMRIIGTKGEVMSLGTISKDPSNVRALGTDNTFQIFNTIEVRIDMPPDGYELEPGGKRQWIHTISLLNTGPTLARLYTINTTFTGEVEHGKIEEITLEDLTTGEVVIAGMGPVASGSIFFAWKEGVGLAPDEPRDFRLAVSLNPAVGGEIIRYAFSPTSFEFRESADMSPRFTGWESRQGIPIKTAIGF